MIPVLAPRNIILLLQWSDVFWLFVFQLGLNNKCLKFFFLSEIFITAGSNDKNNDYHIINV